MVAMTLPPGFRFHPNDDELVGYYLKRKVEGIKIELEVIPVVDLYKFDPWELPDKSFLPKRDMEWFFFCPRDRKYPNGSRTNRATCSGYWKATGKDRKIICESSVFGLRKTLVFYRGRAPGGLRTDWIMHEYRLCENFIQGTINFVGAFALCRIVKRTENGLKIGDSDGGTKAKIMQHSSSMPDLSYRGKVEKLTDCGEESSSVVTNWFDGSIDMSPISSPQNERGVGILPIKLDNEDVTFWGHQVENNSEGSFIGESVSMPSTNLSCLYSSSFMNYTEEAFLVDECNRNECFSPFVSSTFGMYDNVEDTTFYNLEFQAPKNNINASYSAYESANFAASPLLCRQTSEGEEANLWLQEDNILIAI